MTQTGVNGAMNFVGGMGGRMMGTAFRPKVDVSGSQGLVSSRGEGALPSHHSANRAAPRRGRELRVVASGVVYVRCADGDGDAGEARARGSPPGNTCAVSFGRGSKSYHSKRKNVNIL